MESQYQRPLSGAAVLDADLELLGETSALSDDRIFAELIRMTPKDGSTVSRGILPYAQQNGPSTYADLNGANTALVAPNGASGTVLVNPFRAFIGSLTAVGADAKKNWRDLRSAIAVGTTTLGQSVSLAANASGDPRWDLVYARVEVDADGPTVDRKAKDVDTKVVSTAGIVTTLATVVTLGVVTGTPLPSPDVPTITADSGDYYYIPLAFVRVPDGFDSGETVLITDICTVAPCLGISTAAGGHRISAGNQHHNVGGLMLSASVMQAWGASGTRPKYYLPPTVGGGETIFCAIDATTGGLGDFYPVLVDDRDWRKRIGTFMAAPVADLDPEANEWAWGNPSLSGGALPDGLVGSASGFGTAAGMFQTFHCPTALSPRMPVAYVNEFTTDWIAGGASVQIYVDKDNGRLMVNIGGVPGAMVFFWITFSAPFFT